VDAGSSGLQLQIVAADTGAALVVLFELFEPVLPPPHDRTPKSTPAIAALNHTEARITPAPSWNLLAG
jgi:hypothetical protein